MFLNADSHVVAMLYAHLTLSFNLNEICDSLHNYAGLLSRYEIALCRAAMSCPGGCGGSDTRVK